MNKKPFDRQSLQDEIIKKAWQDEEFKQQLVSDPHKAIEEGLGVNMPKDVHINVVEESANVVYLVLPVNPENLPDEMLDTVSGGICPYFERPRCETYRGCNNFAG
jgi:hypothetical protein